MSTYVELEIQNILNEINDLDEVATRLIASLESSPDQFSLDNLNSLARFLTQSGRHLQLVNFVLKHLENESFHVPWPYFLEALGHASLDLDEKTVRALVEGIEETNDESEASRSKAVDAFIPQLKEWRGNRKYRIHKEFLSNKKVLLDQLITLRTQQLYEKEKSLLQRLQKLYPGDSEIAKEVSDHKQRYALEVLAKRAPKARKIHTDDLTPNDPEVEKALQGLLQSLLEHAAQDSSMAFDFTIAAFMLEEYEAALEISTYCKPSESLLWLRLEILLQCRRFVEVLNEIAQAEVLLSHQPETFFATAYLRAQALWGLGQKHTALEVLEGLLAARPHYRAASALFNIWSGQ